MILTGHGEFAVGLYDALTKIAGEQNNFEVVPFDTRENEQVYIEALVKACKSLDTDDTIVVFTDLVGGTPYKMAVQLKLEGYNLRVIGGTNLGMLIDFSLSRLSETDVDVLVANCLNSGRESIQEFELSFGDGDEEEED